VDATAAGVGRVGADGATIHRRRAGRVVDATAITGRVARTCPADDAALNIQRAMAGDTTTAARGAAIAGGRRPSR
jgi:hypothetical protein